MPKQEQTPVTSLEEKVSLISSDGERQIHVPPKHVEEALQAGWQKLEQKKPEISTSDEGEPPAELPPSPEKIAPPNFQEILGDTLGIPSWKDINSEDFGKHPIAISLILEDPNNTALQEQFLAQIGTQVKGLNEQINKAREDVEQKGGEFNPKLYAEYYLVYYALSSIAHKVVTPQLKKTSSELINILQEESKILPQELTQACWEIFRNVVFPGIKRKIREGIDKPDITEQELIILSCLNKGTDKEIELLSQALDEQDEIVT